MPKQIHLNVLHVEPSLSWIDFSPLWPSRHQNQEKPFCGLIVAIVRANKENVQEMKPRLAAQQRWA